MRGENLRSFHSAIILLFLLQSLADVARQEAQRRKQLQEQGVEGKVITGNIIDTASKGSLTTFEPHASIKSDSQSAPELERDHQAGRKFAAQLQKLAGEIREAEEKLNNLRQRAMQQRWAVLGSRKVSGNTDVVTRLEAEISELEKKLKKLRQQRLKVYEAGRKSGYLPGELEGKGIVP